MQFNVISVFGFTVFSDRLSKIQLTNKCQLCNTISPNSYGISTKDPFFRESLKNSDILVLDGVYFALSSILLQGKNIQRNQGPDVFSHFMERINQHHGKVFFLGASTQTLEKIQTRAKIDYPNLTVGVYSPPFKEEFSEEDNKKMVENVNSFKPDVLFVGMTCPKQEKWSYQHKELLDTGLICSIGAVFDWYAGNYKEIRQIWWKLRLGWLIRAIQRPAVLSRNLPNYYIFFKDLILLILHIKKIK